MRKATGRLTENAIRRALLAWLLTHASERDVVLEELGVEHGYSRVDVAVAANRLIGYEIKSDFDTLDRLARQMHAYQRVFDSMTIVTTTTFAKEVETLLPRSWGILLAQQSVTGNVTLAWRRQAAPNPRRNAASVAAMLWRDEAYSFLVEQLGPIVRANANRSEIYEVLARDVPLDVIGARVLMILKARDGARHGARRSTGQKLADRKGQMMVGCVSTPCSEVA